VKRGGDQRRRNAERRQRADVGLAADPAGGNHGAVSSPAPDLFEPREIRPSGGAHPCQRHDDHAPGPKIGQVQQGRRTTETVSEKVQRQYEIGMIAIAPKKCIVVLRLGAKNGMDRPFLQSRVQHRRIGEAGVHPELRRVRHCAQSGGRFPVRRPSLDGIEIGDVESLKGEERAQAFRHGDRIRTLAQRRHDGTVAVALPSCGADHLSAFQVENRNDTQRSSREPSVASMKA